ncbi:helix-turn-helix domain-containing protein [Secundilactobacillus hailunensis]|uniref:Helix-turn-helix domain-containing protein n=1 Tax=Secundilactobacillus hailunensis TaxID=2559923 RepID=A0ABW1T973_9LACO|nr:helix-turn-helix transcriptional regulator [Secundilactobacillus hailunensis]
MNVTDFIQRRKALKMSQRKLCRGICTQATLSRFENNSHVPSLTILTQLCARLGMTIETLYQPEADMVSQVNIQLDEIEKCLMMEDYCQAFQRLSAIDPDQIESVMTRMQFYYLRGLMTALTNGNVLDISYDLSLIFNALDVNQKTVFTPLGFLGMGEMYVRNHQLQRAQFYFDKVNDYLNQLPAEQQDEQYYLRVLMMVYYTAEFEMTRNHYADSKRLIKVGVGLCSNQHVTLYLPDLKFLATQCAIALHQPAQKVQGLMSETLAFAKINQNEVVEVKLAALKRQLEKGQLREA